MKNLFFIIVCFLVLQSSFGQSITSAEYYFDNEVGVGNGIQVSIAQQNTKVDETYSIDISNLNKGFHTIYFRAKNNNDVWSLYDKRVFYISEVFTASDNTITAAEYFFDTEVGVGNGTALSIDNMVNTISQAYTIDVSSLNAGFHTIYIRTKNDKDVWSLYDKRVFFITSTESQNIADITAAEYFFDTEVGIGNGTALSVTAGASLQEVFNIDVSNLDTGFHTIYIRVKNSNDVWSVYDKRTFYISETFTNVVSKITNAEYFFNTIGDYGTGTEIPLPNDFTGSFETEIETNGLAQGEHLLFIRVQNEAGIWSLYDVVAFDIDNSLGTEDVSNQVGVFPNPTTNYINLKTNLQLERYELYDVSGKVIMKNTLVSKSIPTASLSKGIYFLVLQSEKGKIVKRIVKE